MELVSHRRSFSSPWCFFRFRTSLSGAFVLGMAHVALGASSLQVLAGCCAVSVWESCRATNLSKRHVNPHYRLKVSDELRMLDIVRLNLPIPFILAWSSPLNVCLHLRNYANPPRKSSPTKRRVAVASLLASPRTLTRHLRGTPSLLSRSLKSIQYP
jgi:hypothetical protein